MLGSFSSPVQPNAPRVPLLVRASNSAVSVTALAAATRARGVPEAPPFAETGRLRDD